MALPYDLWAKFWLNRLVTLSALRINQPFMSGLWPNLVQVVLLFQPHAHLLEVLSVGEHDALGITNFIQKHLHSFGLKNG